MYPRYSLIWQRYEIALKALPIVAKYMALMTSCAAPQARTGLGQFEPTRRYHGGLGQGRVRPRRLPLE